MLNNTCAAGTKPLRVLVMVSGGGTNLQAIIDRVKDGTITNTEIVGVISNNKNAYALTRAEENQIPSLCISPKDFETREIFNGKLLEAVESCEPDLVVLAGFLVVIPPEMIRKYENRMINIHPSLLPAFRGAHAIEQALAYGVRVFGVTIHYVDATLDGGRIIAQRAFEYEGDDLAELEAKIHAVEHPLYVETIRRLLEERPAAAKSEK